MKKFQILKVVGGLFLLFALVILLNRCERPNLIDSTYTIEATSVGPGGTVSPSTIEVAKGESAAVTLIPDSGFDVDVVKVDGNIESVPTNLIYKFSEVVSNHKLEVTFKKVVEVIMHNIEVLPTTGGTVTSNPTQVADGLGATLTFNALPGFKPDSVIINDKSFSLTGNTYSLTNITEDTKVQGVFGKTLAWYIMSVTWKNDSTMVRHVGDISWQETALWGVPGNLQETLTFLPNGKMKIYWNGVFVGDPLWDIDDSVFPPLLHVGMMPSAPEGTVYILEKLDKKSMIMATYNQEDFLNPGVFFDGKFIYSPL